MASFIAYGSIVYFGVVLWEHFAAPFPNGSEGCLAFSSSGWRNHEGKIQFISSFDFLGAESFAILAEAVEPALRPFAARE